MLGLVICTYILLKIIIKNQFSFLDTCFCILMNCILTKILVFKNDIYKISWVSLVVFLWFVPNHLQIFGNLFCFFEPNNNPIALFQYEICHKMILYYNSNNFACSNIKEQTLKSKKKYLQTLKDFAFINSIEIFCLKKFHVSKRSFLLKN